MAAPWWWSKIAQMCAKIDSLVEASHYDDEKLLAPYALWPSHRHAELKEWLDNRKPKPPVDNR